MVCWRRGAAAVPGACRCCGHPRGDASRTSGGRCGAGAPWGDLPASQTAVCLSARLQDGLMQMVAVARPGDPINVDPGASWTSPRPASTADRGRAMPTRSFSCGRGPTIACGGRSGKERPRLYGRRDTALGRSRGLAERLHMAWRSPREDRGFRPLERPRLCLANGGLAGYLEAEVE
jgi:hypothetical protein